MLNDFPILKHGIKQSFYSLNVKVRGQLGVYRGGSIVFGLSAYPVSEFELVAEELLMSDSIIKACLLEIL